MKLVIAPEAAPWLAPLLESMERSNVVLVAPWASGPVAGVTPKAVPGWRALRGLGRRAGALLGRGADLALGLRLRQAIDETVGRLKLEAVHEVFAPSLGAKRIFARAPHAERVLLVDVPLLRHLHADLDDAAEALPDSTFLENYRAPRALVTRQEEELVLASRVLVTSRVARRRLRAQGVPAVKLGVLPMATRRLDISWEPESPNVLLAGTTASRGGLEVALQAIEQTRGLLLWARLGPGSNVTAVRHPRLRLIEGAPPPVRCVLAPAWVESNAPETDAAVRAGIPLLATDRALGFSEQSRVVCLMAPGDSARVHEFLEATGQHGRSAFRAPASSRPGA